MSKTIEGVPESISRKDYLSLFTAVGLTPDRVKSLEFRSDGVHAEVFEVWPDGSRRLANKSGDGGYAKHTIFIPVMDEGGDAA